MERKEVERVLEKSREFLLNFKGERISLIDINALAFDIWKQIEEENEGFRESRVYCFLKSSLDKLEKTGEFSFIDEDGVEVYIQFIDDTTTAVVLESGTLLICGKYHEEKEEDQ